jgi:hypothetical protein
MASVDLPVGDLPVGTKAILSRQGLQALIDVLGARGYRVLGPTLRDGAIVYDDLAGVADLPAGWTDVQQAGQYRLERRADEALFGYAVGPSSWKRFLHPPLERLWQTQRTSNGFTVTPPDTTVPKFAFLGVRACELHAIQIQDTVLKRGPYRDTGYDRRRQDNFLIAVNCGTAGGTCFCVSMKTGPAVDSGFDLALTELLDAGSHRFLVETGSAAGAAVLAELPRQAATPDDCSAAQVVVARTAQHMGRSLWQLYDGLSNLFLHRGGGSQRPRRRNGGAGAALGFLLQPGFFLHPRRYRADRNEIALPAMDHPQACLLDRSIRHRGLRRLRALHDMVPGRHRYHRRGAGDPGQSGRCRAARRLIL